ALGNALDSRDLAAIGLGAEHQARAHDVAVDDDRAGAAIARAAAFLAARQVELVAQYVEQGLLRLAEELDGLPVYGGRYVGFGHGRSPSAGRRVQKRSRPRGVPGRRRP